jgi:hypothetical protein
MKLTDVDRDIVSDERYYERMLNEISDILTYGVPAGDKTKKGDARYEKINFRIDPTYYDIIGTISERIPRTWFKGLKGDGVLKRVAYAVGCRHICQILQHVGLEKNHEVSKALLKMEKLCTIEKESREKDLGERYRDAMKYMAKNSTDAEIINFVEHADIALKQVKHE